MDFFYVEISFEFLWFKRIVIGTFIDVFGICEVLFEWTWTSIYEVPIYRMVS